MKKQYSAITNVLITIINVEREQIWLPFEEIAHISDVNMLSTYMHMCKI